jgi:hypothetical protein
MPDCLLRDRWGKLDASAYRGLEDLTLLPFARRFR